LSSIFLQKSKGLVSSRQEKITCTVVLPIHLGWLRCSSLTYSLTSQTCQICQPSVSVTLGVQLIFS